MARRRRSAGPEISLFPFLSILACLIGALTILIVALSVSEILQGRKDEAVARAEDYVLLAKEVAAREAEVTRREEERQKSNAAIAELEQLEPRLEKVEADLGRIEEVVSEREAVQRELEELRGQRADLDDRAATVEADLAEGKQRLGELAKQLSKGSPLRILASSDHVRQFDPVFVEAREEGVVVHSPSKTVDVLRAAIGTDADFQKTVEYVAKDRRRLVVFLVRADGRASYMEAERFAREHGALTSKVPLPGSGEVDVKQFFRKR